MSEERKIFCTECGTENSATAKFCCNCGSKLEAAAPVAEAVEEAPVEEAAQESTAGAATPYSAESVVESEPVVEEAMTAAEEVSSATETASAEEISISYGQDNGSFSGSSVYESQPQYYTAEPVVEKKGNKGFAIASMVCGILAVVCCCFTCVSLVLAIAAIGLGIVTLACKYEGKGMAIAGIVLGGIGIVLFIVMIGVAASDGYSEMMDSIMNELY